MSRVLVGYDIHDQRRRRQALKTLRAKTACYQQSFFDCTLSRDEREWLWQRLTNLLDPDEDGLIFAWLDPTTQHALHQRWTQGGNSLYLII